MKSKQHELRFYGRGRVKERGSKVFTSFKIILCHYKSDKHYCEKLENEGLNRNYNLLKVLPLRKPQITFWCISF